ncbi:serine hydrolase domain-containing protein [Virgisporangium ochraceum]|nr:serine hydrolase domain-containing protein [Virgisporangium ochraceum]
MKLGHILVALVVAAGAVAGGTLAACTVDDGPEGGGAPAAGTCDPALDAAFRAWSRAGFSGAVAISTAGRFDCLAGYGSANQRTGARNTADTVYSIGSVTKAFTAASVLRLADEGRLSLDATVGSLLPEVTGPVSAATVRHLLLHTSGLAGTLGADHRPLTRDAAVAAVNRLPLSFPPGTGHAYSNAGYTLLAIVIEAVSGMSYREYTLASTGGRFWDGEPAAPGPRATGYLDDGGPGQAGDFTGPHWALDGNGSLAMTPRQLATWMRSAPAPGTGVDVGEGRSHALNGMVAFDAAVFGTPVVAIAGGGGDVGHDVAAVWVPQRERAIVIASNRPVLTAEKVLAATIRALVGGGDLPTPSAPAAGADLTRAVGTYRLDTGGTLGVTAADGRPTVTATGADAVAALFPPGGRAAAFRAHEQRVLDLLAGRTGEGREERRTLEREHGAVTGVDLAGTLVADGETRTYVTVRFGGKALLGWYAVDDHGTIDGVELPTPPPALALVPVGGTRYRPDDPSGTGPDVTVDVGTDRLTLTTPAGQVTARRAG